VTQTDEQLAAVVSRISPVDPESAAAAQRLLNDKTKPRRSLGRLEDLACQIAAVRRDSRPQVPDKAIVVMGADHGVAAEGVSAYPQDVTAAMMLNFARGGAAINVLARQAGARVLVADMGVIMPLPAHPAIEDHRIAAGTASFTRGPAMTRDQAVAAVAAGVRIAERLAGEGIGLIGIGEMGIGNTTAASALTAVLTGAPPEEVTSRGTGIDDDTLRLKIAAVQRALEHNRPDPNDALDALAKVGGFELAGLCGVVLGAAAARVPIVMDGFPAGVAALAATRIAPAAGGYLIASHRSVEAGHRLVLQALGQKPLLDLDLRLGEGTGAALAMPLIDASLRILAEMATFSAAGVTDTGR
jgi:nicotinate-nucleotide--dimethylbenzimidazole phosphoribosyltransferase